MNTASFRFLLIAAVSIAAPITAFSQELPCDRVADAVRESVARDPSKVLMIVEQSIRQNDVCACEIVKVAIVASKADAATIKQIVYTAAVSAPGMAASIGECALSVAPDASASINQAIQEAVGQEVSMAGSVSSNSGYGDKGGKEVVFDKNPPQVFVKPDAPWAPPVVQDVFLITPVGGIFYPTPRDPVSPSCVCPKPY